MTSLHGDQKRKAKEKLDALLLEGLNSGHSMPADAKFSTDLKMEALAKLKSRKQASSRSDFGDHSATKSAWISWTNSSTSVSARDIDRLFAEEEA